MQRSMQCWLAIFTLLLCGSLRSVQAYDAIRLASQERPPYTWSVDGVPAGPFDQVVMCALQRLGVSHHITYLPWARAQSLTEHGQMDGFYAGSLNAKRDEYANASRFIAKQNWAYFYLKQSFSFTQPLSLEQLQVLSIGTYRGSNMAKWLESQDLVLSYRPQTPDRLLDGLLRGRADVILANQAAMLNFASKRGKAQGLAHQAVLSKPLVVYFGHAYLDKNPGFLVAFNQAASQCLPSESIVLYSE